MLARVRDFLPCPTPDAWFDRAMADRDVLLIDHANCEKKAAGTALSLVYRYVDRPPLLLRISRLAREELHHFEQVLDLMQTLGVSYRQLSASRYAAGLRALARTHEPARLVDSLLTGAVVEARSCERFAGLAERCAAPLGPFYRRLVDAEARHFGHYLELARSCSEEPIEPVLGRLLARERELVQSPDPVFRFHSGHPTAG